MRGRFNLEVELGVELSPAAAEIAKDAVIEGEEKEALTSREVIGPATTKLWKTLQKHLPQQGEKDENAKSDGVPKTLIWNTLVTVMRQEARAVKKIEEVKRSELEEEFKMQIRECTEQAENSARIHAEEKIQQAHSFQAQIRRERSRPALMQSLGVFIATLISGGMKYMDQSPDEEAYIPLAAAVLGLVLYACDSRGQNPEDEPAVSQKIYEASRCAVTLGISAFVGKAAIPKENFEVADLVTLFSILAGVTFMTISAFCAAPARGR